MNINVEAVLIVSGLIFITTMGGLGALWIMVRRDHRAAWRRLERGQADRS